MTRLTKTNGELISIYGNMLNGSRAGKQAPHDRPNQADGCCVR